MFVYILRRRKIYIVRNSY